MNLSPFLDLTLFEEPAPGVLCSTEMESFDFNDDDDEEEDNEAALPKDETFFSQFITYKAHYYKTKMDYNYTPWVRIRS